MSRKKTHEEYVVEVAEKNPNVEVVGKYQGSEIKIVHRCKYGHEYKMTPHAVLSGHGCPYCSGRNVIVGETDLTTTHPDLCREWHSTRNQDLLPNNFSKSSMKKVWWKCSVCGYEWLSTIDHRTRGSGCPECARIYKTSNKEMIVYYYIKKYFSDAISTYQDTNNRITELDIFIPSLNVGIEYDGERWHTDIKKDKIKDDICKNIGINLIRIREPKCEKYESNCTFIYLSTIYQKDLQYGILEVLRTLNVLNPDINLERDFHEIINLRTYKIKEKSLSELYPEVAAEWHPTKNGLLQPNMITCGSGQKVWWLCRKCGYEYFMSIKHRTNGHGCPECKKEKCAECHYKRIIRLRDGLIYQSISMAAEDNDLCRNTLTSRCKTHKDFMYYDEWLAEQENLKGEN